MAGPQILPAAIRVSAIVPNYNHGNVLGAAIHALQRQTVPVDEIIVVDDGSTDGSRDLLAELVAGDSRLRVVHHEQNRGAIPALNTGIAAATGTHLYLGAADDTVRPDLVAVLAAVAGRHRGVGLVCAEVLLTDLRTGVTSLRPATRPSPITHAFSPPEVRSLLSATDNFILTGGALLDREKVLACGGLRPELGSFADGFLVRQLALRHGFVFVPELVADWHVDEAGLSRRTAADPVAAKALIAAVRSAVASDPAFPPDYADRFERRWRFGVLRLALDKGMPAPELLHALGTGAVRSPLFPVLAGIPGVGRVLALAVLTLTYRPFSLRGLLRTALDRARS